MIAAPTYAHHPIAARLLLTYAKAECDPTWASLEESADRLDACEAIANEIRAREEDWQAQLLNAIEAEEPYDD